MPSVVRAGRPVSYADGSPLLDAFGRQRVSPPQSVFDTQLTYDLAPLIYEAVATNGGGGTSTVAHDATNRCALMTFAAALTGAEALMQTYQYFRYQPGKSQEIFVTFNMIEKVANVLKFAGYSDGVNGVEFQLNGTQARMVIYSSTGNGNEIANQADWNEDTLDGTGGPGNPSGLLLDVTKTLIFFIDLQALYVGEVRLGFNINGRAVGVHHFNHSNIVTLPYIADANRPIRCGMSSTGTVSTTMRFICSSVISEGGQEEAGYYRFCTPDVSVSASNGARTHLLSIRPKTTFNGITYRANIQVLDVDLLVTGNAPVYWELVIGQAITGTTTFNDVNAAYSGVEYNTLGTISGNPAVVLDNGYIPASAQSKGSTGQQTDSRAPITLNRAGLQRANGTISLLVSGIGAASVVRGALCFKETR